MNITIVCVGKLKEEYWRAAAGEYVKRLGRFAKIKITELSESKSDNIDEESSAIVAHIPKGAYVIALDVKGKEMTSEGLAGKIKELGLSSRPDICFIIGGSCGYNDEVRNLADLKLSFSKFTFPHQLMRVILLEQIYRAFKINAGEKYHK